MFAHARFEHHVDIAHRFDDWITGGGGKGLSTADDVLLGAVAD